MTKCKNLATCARSAITLLFC